MRQVPRTMPALVTPFTARGAVDLDAHTHNIEAMQAAGMKGILIGGSTGEGPYLEGGEREALVDAARATSPQAFLLCGLAGESLRIALSQAEEAASGGADAVLAMTPTTLLRRTPRVLAGFYRELADRSPLPVFLYSVPAVTAFELTMETAIELSEHPGIVGMKDSGGHPVRASTIAAGAAAGFKLCAGASAAVALSIGGGAHGAITASGNYVPGLVIETVAAARRSPAAAAPVQEQLAAISSAVESAGIAGVKYAASRCGLLPGFLRRPLRPAGSTVRRRIEDALRAMDRA